MGDGGLFTVASLSDYYEPPSLNKPPSPVRPLFVHDGKERSGAYERI